ncbi:Leucine-rich_repeat domain superfamily [Hexamita inflata]|uniref:Leucine-rich repeat domain superfamily n=1 Tax=Hexamita inflata TaxID=28002 RepID=A0AA86U2A7_9EUKA|nr:Leucine-rich repeat domain superfamily [Hexamita inflata]
MIRKYEGNIKDGNLEICDLDRGDPEVTNYMFLEKLNIKALKICIKNGLSVKLRNDMIKELTIRNVMDEQQQLIFYVNDLELENLEVLDLEDNNLENDQLYNLAKFKKLRTLNISNNIILIFTKQQYQLILQVQQNYQCENVVYKILIKYHRWLI